MALALFKFYDFFNWLSARLLQSWKGFEMHYEDRYIFNYYDFLKYR